MNTTAPTAAVNSIRVTKAKAAYHKRLYFTPELLKKEREEQEKTEITERKKKKRRVKKDNKNQMYRRNEQGKAKKTDVGNTGLKKNSKKKKMMFGEFKRFEAALVLSFGVDQYILREAYMG